MRIQVRVRDEELPREVNCTFQSALRSLLEKQVGHPISAEAIEVLAIDGRPASMTYHQLVVDRS